ncbi:hypothetical protein CK203_063041 [Vitis vinifera]|uniref:Uncharacterized protein n=1 Tax=Vitis vinifera TaxID=29760 RepID=A0A438G5M0_VITVI|nr:hypothetical protein CK203_063041 [Vitis vinifera]
MLKASAAVIKSPNFSIPTLSSFHRQAHSTPLSSSSSSSLIVSNFKSGSPLQRLLLLPKMSTSFRSSTEPRPIPPLSAAYGDQAPLPEAPAKVLRRILDSPGVHQGPACFDALSAQLVERAGFQYCFTSGICVVFGMFQWFHDNQSRNHQTTNTPAYLGCFGDFVICLIGLHAGVFGLFW